MKEKHWLVFFCLGGLVFPGILIAEDFRIETKIFVGESPRPAAENLTLFFEEDVYDFQLKEELGEITILDSKRDRFILLDPTRQVKTTIPMKNLLKIAAKMRGLALKKNVLLLRFAAEPTFQITFDEKRGHLAMTSPLLSYEIQTEKVDDAQKRKQYRQFSDKYTYLNATQPRALPIQARLAVNQELDKRGRIPTQVTRTIVYRGKKSDKRSVASSRHKVSWELRKEDHARIQKCKQQLVQFKEIRGDRYRQAPAEARRKGSAKR